MEVLLPFRTWPAVTAGQSILVNLLFSQRREFPSVFHDLYLPNWFYLLNVVRCRLKYYWLLFSDNDILSLDDWVFSTEA